jgi:hypothetical protein
MCSSGLRIGAICTLRIRNFLKIPKYGIYQVTVYENTRDEYTTFTTVELASLVDSYLEYRKHNGERLTPNSPLLREEFDCSDPIRANSPRPICTNSLRARIFRLIVISGLRARKNSSRHIRHEVMQTHGLRKSFYSTAIIAGMNSMYVSLLAGHKIGLQGVYFKPTAMDLLEGNDKMRGYASIIIALTIGGEERLRQEVKKLSEKSRYSKNVIEARLEEGQIEAAELKKSFNQEIETLKKQVTQDVKEQVSELLVRLKPEIIKEGLST